MDGNLTAEGMTADLESMKEVGIGNLVFLEVNVGVPRGKIDFLSEPGRTCSSTRLAKRSDSGSKSRSAPDPVGREAAVPG